VLDTVSHGLPHLSATNGRLRVIANPDQDWRVAVYSQLGKVVLQLESKGSKSISLPNRSGVLYVHIEAGDRIQNIALLEN